MQRTWITLGCAAALALSLTACGGDSTDTQKMQPDGTTQSRSMTGTGSTGVEQRTAAQKKTAPSSFQTDGRYYADGRGRVADQETGLTEWEKMGRTLQDSWDSMMDQTRQAGKDMGKAITGNPDQPSSTPQAGMDPQGDL